MKSITFIDSEIEPKSGRLLDIGGIRTDGIHFHSNSINDFIKFLNGADYICGHNILNHDLKYLKNAIQSGGISHSNYIDTLYLSPLLFPARPYHALLKDDKLQADELNNPLNDSIKARDLFFDEVSAFNKLDDDMKVILYNLLKSKREFKSFFKYISYQKNEKRIEEIVRERFHSLICERSDLQHFISNHPIELSYCLALINIQNRYSITPPWVLKNFPSIERLIYLLRGNPCIEGCKYCNESLDIYKGLKQYFGFDSYRTYEGEPLQEKAVKAAIENKSLLAVFPTGGGKSITFQVPALMNGASLKGLTIIISPLQSLMKDQVDNLENISITEAVTVNGLLDPIERAKSYERVEDGSASILYLSPESLRSKTIEKLVLGRKIARFVIDEAHCFSSWGQDFRVDYLYIGEFIKMIQEKKNLDDTIPVSCFTATAKQKVIADICEYFKEKLGLDLEVFSASAARSNLHYTVIPKETEEDKYYTVRNLISEKKCPTIVYVSRTKKATDLARRLTQDGFEAKTYHGKMDKPEKSENQDAFIRGEVQTMVATSAFGMGVDKKDVGMVIHYEISDSLENYIQEAGRAGRDENISAECYVLFNDIDLGKHFTMLNQTKLNISEIQQIWKAVKHMTRLRSRVSQSALEIARRAGWDDTVNEIETRVITAISALEEAGYLKRGQNMPRIYADSILAKNAEEAISKINASDKFDEKQRKDAVRIIKSLIGNRSRKAANGEETEARVDYISDRLGILKEDVIETIYLLRDEKILSDMKDLSGYLKKKENKNPSLEVLKNFWQIEEFLIFELPDGQKVINIKELNEKALENECKDVNLNAIKIILNFWAIKQWIKQRVATYSKNHILITCIMPKEEFKEKFHRRKEIARSIVEYLYKLSCESDENDEETRVEFSVIELKMVCESSMYMLGIIPSQKEIEDALFYLSRIGSVKIEGGFLVTYKGLDIERLEKDNKRRYKLEDYQKLSQYYQNKVQQIHIVGEYAQKMIRNYNQALQFVDDYFQLNLDIFLSKYFKGERKKDINRNITPAKFKALFGDLSPAQLKIINDKDSKYIVVAAGPGSGKTRILVHKLASLLLMEDVKHEQLLMVTFSRAAATEFKLRLQKLVGVSANYVEIKTFHSYCFDLLGRMGTIEKSAEIIQEAVKKILNDEVDMSRIAKTVIVIDEAQDMDENEYALIEALMDKNDEMRVIAVGDDDQNIFEFRGASVKYMEQLIHDKGAVVHELLENYRSKSNLVDYSNQFVLNISYRLKENPIQAVQKDKGNINIIKYYRRNLITPVVNDIFSTNLKGSTCVITKTNEEALQITGMLIKRGLPAKLIQSNEGFSLYNLLEVRFFLSLLNLSEDTHTIDDEIWTDAKRKVKIEFSKSSNLEICVNLIKSFEMTNTRIKFKSDLEVFILESKLEDFYDKKIKIIYVSTIHKTKGREFDNVIIELDQFKPNTNEATRQLYVAMTRAKCNLSIHYNGNYLDHIKTNGLKLIEDKNEYQLPDQYAIQLTYKDVWLDHFYYCQDQISELVSGDEILAFDDCCRNIKGKVILKYSKLFLNKIEKMKQKNYFPQEGKIKNIVYWKKEDSDHEIRIILPELYLKKRLGPQGSRGDVSFDTLGSRGDISFDTL